MGLQSPIALFLVPLAFSTNLTSPLNFVIVLFSETPGKTFLKSIHYVTVLSFFEMKHSLCMFGVGILVRVVGFGS